MSRAPRVAGTLNVVAIRSIRLLLRRSKDTQEESLETQLANANRFCNRMFPGVPRATYVDDDVSGDDFLGREDLRRLVEETRSGDVVVTRDIGRVGRKMTDTGKVIVDQILGEKRARLFTYADGREVTAGNAIETMMLYLQTFGAQFELENIRSRTKEALRTRFREGSFIGAIPYGYRRLPRRKGERVRVEIIKEQATIVRRIFALCAEGSGAKVIASLLNEEGVPSPTGKTWATTSIQAVLRREVYRGLAGWGRTQPLRRNRKRLNVRPTVPAETREDETLRIIDDETWYATRDALEQRGAHMADSNRVAGHNARHALSSIARCSHCGSPIFVRTFRRKYQHGAVTKKKYSCMGHSQRGDTVCPVTLQQPIEEVEGVLAGYIADKFLASDSIASMVEDTRAWVEGQLKKPTADVAEIESRLAKAKAREKGLAKKLGDLGEDDSSALMAEYKECRVDVRRLESEVGRAKQAPKARTNLVNEITTRVRTYFHELRATLMTGDSKALRSVFQAFFPDGLIFTPHTLEKPVKVDRWLRRTVWKIEGTADALTVFHSKQRPLVHGFEWKTAEVADLRQKVRLVALPGGRR